MDLGRCQNKPCGVDEVEEILEIDQTYNLYDGEYFIKTTIAAYNDHDQRVKDGFY